MPTKAARTCVMHEIHKHCANKRRRCKGTKERSQAVAIGYAVCRRKGFTSIPKRKRRR